MGENSLNGAGKKLAESLGSVNIPTIILIILTGGGNLISSLQNRGEIDLSRERVFRQVDELHSSLTEFEKRQDKVLEGIERSLKNQEQILASQNKVMESDTRILEQLHR